MNHQRCGLKPKGLQISFFTNIMSNMMMAVHQCDFIVLKETAQHMLKRTPTPESPARSLWSRSL